MEYYTQFGKLYRVPATGSVNDVFASVKNAILPQSLVLMGPKASGKTSVAVKLEKKLSAQIIDFSKYLKDNNLTEVLEEEQITEFINYLARGRSHTIILENFP